MDEIHVHKTKKSICAPSLNHPVFVLGEKYIKNVPLVNREKVLLPPFHIKLGLIKKFVKVLQILLYKVSTSFI